jgi:putative spermidine/putrescine transport system ATP-binding protein
VVRGDLEVRGLARDVGDFRLTADFIVASGERAALVGRSGSGKTTLLRMLAGLEAPDRGGIRIGERDITRLPPRRRSVGLVFQEPALFPALNVLENAAYGLRMRGIPRREREERALEWLRKLRMESHARSPVHRLSGGERQRVAFIRALIWQPELILLDEPFSALDVELREILRHELLELHRLCPAPLVLVTHDEADAARIATLRLTIQEGEGGKIRRVQGHSP